jgi:hypothetical protein
MTNRIVRYSTPQPFHKSLPGSTRICIMKRDDGIPDGYEPPKRKVPKVRNARNEHIDDDIGERAEKGITMSDNVDRGPYYRMIESEARARQAITGETFQKAFTECYCDPSNAVIRNAATSEHLAQSHDNIFGTRLSAIPVAKAAPAYDPLRKAAEIAESYGPAHAKMHSLAVDHQRAHAGQSYAAAYSYLYTHPQNVSLRNAVKDEHMRATTSGFDDERLDKAAALPMDPPQDDVVPGSARQDLHELVVERMKRQPHLTYERAFVAEYLHPRNASLKQRYDQESVQHMRTFTPAKPFPRYTSPGHSGVNAASNVGREGRGGEDF